MSKARINEALLAYADASEDEVILTVSGFETTMFLMSDDAEAFDASRLPEWDHRHVNRHDDDRTIEVTYLFPHGDAP